jgi:hypothetical protein
MATRKLTLGRVDGGKVHVLERQDNETWGSICLRVWEDQHDIEIVKDSRVEPDCKFCLKVLGRR